MLIINQLINILLAGWEALLGQMWPTGPTIWPGSGLTCCSLLWAGEKPWFLLFSCSLTDCTFFSVIIPHEGVDWVYILKQCQKNDLPNVYIESVKVSCLKPCGAVLHISNPQQPASHSDSLLTRLEVSGIVQIQTNTTFCKQDKRPQNASSDHLKPPFQNVQFTFKLFKIDDLMWLTRCVWKQAGF